MIETFIYKLYKPPLRIIEIKRNMYKYKQFNMIMKVFKIYIIMNEYNYFEKFYVNISKFQILILSIEVKYDSKEIHMINFFEETT